MSDRGSQIIAVGLAAILIFLVYTVFDRWHSEALCKDSARAWVCVPNGSYTKIGSQIIPNESCACR